MVDTNLQQELREFMEWTRGELNEISANLQELAAHTIRQNGHIELVMDRERATRACAETGARKADAALKELASLAGRVLVVEEVGALTAKHATGKQAELADEMAWLRDNFWKLALGGISLLTLAQKLIDVLSNTP